MISYREALTYRLLHKEGIQKINKIIEKSQTRYSMSKYDEDDNDSPQWYFSFIEVREYDSPLEWCFSLKENFHSLQLQCINCILCGGYIERFSYPNKFNDPKRLIKYIYCDNINHHSITNKKNQILHIKTLLKNYDISKHRSHLYHASLKSIMLLDIRLDIFYEIFIEYLGISFHPW